MTATEVPSETTRAVIARVFECLDYTALGDIYCEDGGVEFWRQHREPAHRLGEQWASELGRRLPASGASLYVGAGVAEIPAMVVEVLDLGRDCIAVNLRGLECAAINDALAAAGVAGLRIEEAEAVAAARRGSFDHLSMVSVVSDPETYPWLSEVTYGRIAPIDLDVDAFTRERDAARELVGDLLASLAPRAIVTTTIEELPWILEQRGDREAVADETMIDTAIVGDPIGFLSLIEPGHD